MLKLWKLLLICLVVLAVFAAPVVRAADDDDDDDDTTKTQTDPQLQSEDVLGETEGEGEEEDEEAEGIPFGPHPDVETSVIFPDYPDRKLPLGQPISVLIGFYNKGKGAFNITGAGAHLQSPVDLSYYIHNFTARRIYGSPVGPGQRATVEYVFGLDPQYEPLKYWFSAWVLYNNTRDEMFVNTFFNSTIEMVEPKADIKSTIFTWALLLGGAGLLVYYYFQNKKANKGGKKKKDQSKVAITDAVPDYVYTPSKTSQPARSRSSSKGKPKSK